ncbi:MAG: hypothetical protein J7K68_03025 [Candidatus Diapherotrites archaeon]|nr:hypothetical protein [Candidatus Diapherotrites archaeon]
MKKGFVTFLLVLAFLPTAIEILTIQSRVASYISDINELAIEQQSVTNLEYDFYDSFWMTARYSSKKTIDSGPIERKIVLVKDLKLWKKNLEEMHSTRGASTHVWIDEISLNIKDEINKTHDSFSKRIYDYIHFPSKRYVSVHESDTGNRHAVIGATIKKGKTTSVYIIPGGDYIEI